MADEHYLLALKFRVRPASSVDFGAWQTELHQIIAAAPGFISLEIDSPADAEDEWKIIQRFKDESCASLWNSSAAKRELMEKLPPLLADPLIREEMLGKSSWESNVTEVFITHVRPEHEPAYRAWIAKIHQCEAQFPGFRGVYVQSSSNTQGGNWITLLQFDKPENLDRWLASPERKRLLQESTPWIGGLESHRVISPYSSWFSGISKTGPTPPVWKSSMIILLVLFPIVMLEFKYLNPLTQGLNLSLATFLGNAISVSLLSWPMLPLAIRGLQWWLLPQGSQKHFITMWGTLLLLLVYVFEILLFWRFL